MNGKRQLGLFANSNAELPPWELDDQPLVLVAEVALPAAPYGPFDYLVPPSLAEVVRVGMRLQVPLGKGNRSVVGYCVAVTRRPGSGRTLKAIERVIDAQPLVTPALLSLTRWMSDYYLCEWGRVLEGIVPAGVRGGAGVQQRVWYVATADWRLRADTVKVPPTQLRILHAIAGSLQPLTLHEICEQQKCTPSPVKALVDKRLIELRRGTVQVAPGRPAAATLDIPLQLNPSQQRALERIRAAVDAQDPCTLLLHGVTGSGKTEVYIQAIEEVVRRNRQAIVLVPEISLTAQTRQRFAARFHRVAVLHSHLSDSERHWHWQRIAAGEIDVVVGARSAIFAPLSRLGLLVIDEEHDSSFKQDTVPRYQARDVARFRASQEQAPLILGSATPSLDSWYGIRSGETTLISLPERVSDLPLPGVELVDLRDSRRSFGPNAAISRPLFESMREALRQNGQIILLMNRRGHSTNIQCPACGFVVTCPDCDIALTLHLSSDAVVPQRGSRQDSRRAGEAICHHCDYRLTAPRQCPKCSFEGIRFAGSGTQKLEHEVRGLFPSTNILRIDADTMRQPGSHEKAFARFRAGDVRILLGTQMIAKGLDFPDVTLVGVINADQGLHLPDFRAAERTFQLVTQVAGRSGRSLRGGRVIVQAFTPEHAAIQHAAQHDYVSFANEELRHREMFQFPPYTQLIRWIVRGEHALQVKALADAFVQAVRRQAKSEFPLRILGPAPCPLPRIRRRLRMHVLLTSPDGAALRAIVRKAIADLTPPVGVQFQVDVDPWDML